MRKYCYACEEESEYRIVSKAEKFPVRGESIEVDSKVCICSTCGEEIFCKELDYENLEKVYAVYRGKHGLLSPNDIRTIRERYGLSQRGLSRVLGWGDITMHRYESGALPDRVHSDLLKMISSPEGMLKYLEQNRDLVPNGEAESVRQSIGPSKKSFDLKSRFKHVFEVSQGEAGQTIHTGYKLFDMERLKNMVLYLAEDSVWKTKLNKLLWYADFLAYRRHACSLSGLAYQRYTHGPMPFHANSMLDALSDEDVIELEETSFSNGTEGTQIRPIKVTDLSAFTEREVDVLKFVRDFFHNYSSGAISDYSHKEKAWLEVPQSEVIPYGYALELSLQ